MKVQSMKTICKLFAVLAVLAIALVPIMAAEESDATVKRVGQCETSGFTDYDKGTLKITLNNDATEAVNVMVKVYDFNDQSSVRAEKTSELTANENTVVSLSWGYGSSGTKQVDVYVYAYNTETQEIGEVLAQENCVEIDVSHSIWKNSVTYIVIVLIIIVAIIAIVLFIRSGKKTKADTTMADKTFTKMHREKTAKRSATAEKKEYTSSGNRSRKSK